MKTLSGCTRREALGLLALGTGAAAIGVNPAWAATSPAPVQPVTAYFLDGLVRDMSGRLPAYRAPAGFAGCRGIARMDDAAMRMNGIEF